MIPLEVRRFSGRVLVVDDEPANVALLERLLEIAGCVDVHSTTDPRRAVDLCEATMPDIVLLDLMMPHLDGLAVTRLLTERFPCRLSLPILILTADSTSESRYQALAAGVSDFLTKPFDALELVLRLNQHVRSRNQHLELLASHIKMEARVYERTRELDEAQAEIIERLAIATELRDDDTGMHVERVASLTARIAAQLGIVPGEVETLRRAVRLHDIGKISVPDSILRKPGALTDEEYATMRQHTTVGARVLAGSRFPVIMRAEEIARCHHERWDGGGYPSGLVGESIPLSARIAAVADVYDALTTARSYKAPWSAEEAKAEIVRQSGTQFDPRVVEAFVEVLLNEEAAHKKRSAPIPPPPAASPAGEDEGRVEAPEEPRTPPPAPGERFWNRELHLPEGILPRRAA